jgi:Fur family ferric uptake transcriptional regulator
METVQMEALLKKHSLRVTQPRLRALEALLAAGRALSQPDLEKSLGTEFDRVTIYRTLTSFLDQGLIHKVPDDAGVTRYALCRHNCNAHAHQDEHIHFKCNACGETQCLEDVPLPRFHAPQGFQFLDTNVLIQGVCNRCNG